MSIAVMDEDADQRLPLEQELTCPVCRGIFQDPVLLQCSHSFCRECVERSRQVSSKCPVCRDSFEEDQIISNRALAGASESFLKQAHWGASLKCPTAETCNIHLRSLDLYCEKDEEPVCVECVSLHSAHGLLSIRDGAQRCKKELSFIVRIFEKKLESSETMARKLSKTVEHIKYQANQGERQIREEFERLHKILAAEENRRLNDLAAEGRQKTSAVEDMIAKLSFDIVSLKKLIDDVKKEMGKEDLPLLQSFQKVKRNAHWTQEEPQYPQNSLLNMGEHVGSLGFKIWKKLQAHITYNPVVLNPNTASPWLSLSTDLTSMKESSERLTFPDNPERFEPCVFALGAEGYTCGKHRWEVIVGENPKWVLGVCRESLIRKKKFTISTSRGVWAIGLSKGVYSALVPEPTELHVQQRPERIRVKLNMDKGEVSFWDVGTEKHLVTLTHPFSEKMFPIFGPGLQSIPMTLAPGKIVVHSS